MTALLGPHRTPKGKSDTYITPQWIVDALGPFDMDPCCPPIMPWRTAERMIHYPEDGLAAEWHGRVWLNPPYSREGIGKWMAKMAAHNNGIALVFARTGTEWAQEARRVATAALFMKGRITFCLEDGSPVVGKDGKPSSAGCDFMFLAFGAMNMAALLASGIEGNLSVEVRR